MEWLKLQIAILKEIYQIGRTSYQAGIEEHNKARLKVKRAKNTFKAGKLIEK